MAEMRTCEVGGRPSDLYLDKPQTNNFARLSSNPYREYVF